MELDLSRYLSGEALYGDDLSADGIRAWYDDEAEGYADLGAWDRSTYSYSYHALNRRHLFRHIPGVEFDHALGFGSAYGDEFLPLRHRVRRITILDPSERFSHGDVGGVPTRWVRPHPSGDIEFESGSFSLATCLGVLHHIPNVSHVLKEIVRTLAPGGYFALREPIVSMGDWRKPRPGLTRHERGIPLDLLFEMVRATGAVVVASSLCDFPLTRHLARPFVPQAFNSAVFTRLGEVLARAFRWNLRYHAERPWHKLRPCSVAVLLQKPE